MHYWNFFDLLASGGCGGSLSGSTGTVTSPNYPNDYPNNVYCEWTITVPEEVILLTFNDLNIEFEEECYYDSLKVPLLHQLINLLTWLVI